MWRNGLISKLHAAGIDGKVLSFLRDYLSNRTQKVVLPGGSFKSLPVRAGVPQGSVLGPLMFLVYINDIVDNLESVINLFADDTILSIEIDTPNISGAILQSDIEKINNWADRWLVKFNPSKSKSLLISRKRVKPDHPVLTMSNIAIPSVQFHKHLGICLSCDGSWDQQIQSIVEKAWKRINILRRLKFLLDRLSLQTIYFSFIRPILEYGDTVWDNMYEYHKEELDKIQNEAAKIVTGCTKLVSLSDLSRESGWETLRERRNKHKHILFFKMVNGLVPNYLCSLVPSTVGSNTTYNLRNSNDLANIVCRTSLYRNSFLPSAVNAWNSLPQATRKSDSLSSFKRLLNIDKPTPCKLYFYGERKMQIIHTRFRNNCSDLKEHLFWKNIVASPLCRCGEVESNTHYFFEYRFYCNIRVIL